MRIALAQINPTVGDVAGNARLVLEAMEHARRDGAQLLVTPELCLLGYPPRDLLQREGVVEACERAVAAIARAAAGITVLVGHPRRCDEGARPLRNSVSAVRDGECVGIYDKRLLPSYDVFDEDRHFSPGTAPLVIEVGGRRVGILVCEDLWRADDTSVERRYGVDCAAETRAAGAEVLVVPSASPFVLGKREKHLVQVVETARRTGCPVVSVNQVGANDDLIFDGASIAVAADGTRLAEAGSWRESMVHLDLTSGVASVATPAGAGEPAVVDATRSTEGTSREPESAQLFKALVLGVRDYFRKTGHQRAILGLSGGIDSALTATIAAAALGPANVIGLLMPSRYSSPGSIEDAKELAQRLRLGRVETIPIEPAHEALATLVQRTLGDAARGVVDENLQSRIRGILVMAHSNAAGALALATGNKSELAVGYTTMYGDMVGALAVIGDLVKGRVYALSRWINANAEACGFDGPPIPVSSLEKAPSAELRPNQTDQDSLPPYEALDPIVESLVEEEREATAGLAADVLRQLDRNEYKRRQAPVILKVTSRAFGPGRRMPLAMRQTAMPGA